MQLALPFGHDTQSPHPAGPAQFYFVRHRRARRYIVRVDADGRVRVTIPRGGSKREAGAFAQRHLEWIEGQRRRLASPAVAHDQRQTLRARAAIELPTRVSALAAATGTSV